MVYCSPIFGSAAYGVAGEVVKIVYLSEGGCEPRLTSIPVDSFAVGEMGFYQTDHEILVGVSNDRDRLIAWDIREDALAWERLIPGIGVGAWPAFSPGRSSVAVDSFGETWIVDIRDGSLLEKKAGVIKVYGSYEIVKNSHDCEIFNGGRSIRIPDDGGVLRGWPIVAGKWTACRVGYSAGVPADRPRKFRCSLDVRIYDEAGKLADSLADRLQIEAALCFSIRGREVKALCRLLNERNLVIASYLIGEDVLRVDEIEVRGSSSVSFLSHHHLVSVAGIVSC